METMNIFEAVRIATDPSLDGTAHRRVDPKEVLERLGKLGFVVVPRPLYPLYTFETEDRLPVGGIEQYQAEDR